VIQSGDFFGLEVYTKEKINLADLVLAKIAELTEIPKPMAGIMQDIVVVHVESTGDMFYGMKEQSVFTELLTVVLQETLNTIIVRDLPTAKAIWPETFAVDYIKSRLIGEKGKDLGGKKKKVQGSDIFVVPFSEDGLYYRARVINPVSEEKVLVLFVDYGNRDVVEYKDIVLLDYFDKAILAVPPQCRHARIAGLETFSNMVDLFLEKCENNFRICKNEDSVEDNVIDAYPLFTGSPNAKVNLQQLVAIADQRNAAAGQ